MKKLRSCLALLLAVIMLVPSFILPAASQEPDFTVSVAADKTDYSVGDTVTATVYVAPTGKTVNSYQFTIDCSSYLEVQSCTSKIGNPKSDPQAEKNGTYAFVVTGKGATIEGEKLAIAEIKFKVLGTFEGTVAANIGLKDCYVGEQGNVNDPYTVFENAVYVNLHKHVIKLVGDVGGLVNGGADVVKLYAKHNVPGLYSDADCTAPVTSVTVGAKDGFVLTSPQWFDGMNCYADFAAVASTSFTDSKTIYLQTVKKPILTVSNEGVTGGVLSKTGELVVLPDADVSDQTLRDAGFVPTAKDGYTFAGWNVGGQTLGTTGTVKVSGDVTVKPVFTANKYGFEGPAASEDYTAKITGGVDADGKVTHDTDVTMTITPSANHAVQVGYTVNGTPHVITPTNGVYTIPGKDILGDVVVTVTPVEYRTVTFKAGDGVDMTETKLYTLPGNGGLFTDPTCTKHTDAPVPTLKNDGYRAPVETNGEAWWTDESGKTYTSAALKTGPINDDLVVTANAIKQIVVSFVAGENGSLEGTLTQTVDAGSSFASIPKPETIAAAGYNFKEWAPVVKNVGSEDVTFTATFVRGQYTVSLPSTDTYDITVTAADGIISNGNGNYTVTYGTDVNFAIAGKNGATITEVSYKVEGKDAVVLGTAAGSYKIPGGKITAAVGISVTVDNRGKITFKAGDHGSYDGATYVDRYFENGYTLTEADIPVPTPDAGYEFSGWNEEPEGHTVSGTKEFTAWYAPGKYEVKIDGETKDYATYLEDYKLPAYSDAKVITGIKVAVAGKDVEVAKDTAGNFVIPGSAIIGTVDVTTTTTPVTVTFIYQEQYGAIASGKMMAVLQTTKLDGNCYALSDGVAFFWSDKYQAYVRFVSADMTKAQLASQLKVVEGAAVEIVYDGNISGNNSVNVVDAGIINDTLTGNVDPDQVTDIMRFKMDVSNDKPSDTVTEINGQYIQVTTGDIQTIINTSVGK